MRRIIGADGVGRVVTEFEVANFGDIEAARRGLMDADRVRRLRIKGVMDSGAVRFVLPRAIIEQLGLPLTGKTRVRYADGRTATRPTAQGVYVELLGRSSTFTAIAEPNRDSALIGAIVLEDLDLLVDCTHNRLVPRDPRGPIYEIE